MADSGTVVQYLKIEVRISGKLTKTISGPDPEWKPLFEYSKTLKDGATAGLVETCSYADTTVGSSAGVSLDLSGTGIQDGFGSNLALDTLNVVAIKNKSTTAGQVLNIGGGSDDAGAGAVPLFANPEEILPLGPDGLLLVVQPSLAGIAVTNSSADILRIKNTVAATVAYERLLAGRET